MIVWQLTLASGTIAVTVNMHGILHQSQAYDFICAVLLKIGKMLYKWALSPLAGMLL